MFKGRHFDKSVILLCVPWYLAYNLSLHNLKEIMAERGIDSNGDTVEFYFSRNLDLHTAKRFIHKALAHHGRSDRITIDGSQTNRMAIIQYSTEISLQEGHTMAETPIAIRTSKYMNTNIEQDHRRIKRRIRSMLGFKSETAANITLSGRGHVWMSSALQPFSIGQKFGINDSAADSPSDLPNGLADSVEKSSAGVFHEMPAICDGSVANCDC